MKTFNEFLEEKFMEVGEFCGRAVTKDSCEYLFVAWLDELDPQEFIDFGEEFKSKIIAITRFEMYKGITKLGYSRFMLNDNKLSEEVIGIERIENYFAGLVEKKLNLPTTKWADEEPKNIVWIEHIKEMIGKNREYLEYMDHHKENQGCICMDCNRTWGINKEKERMRSVLEDFINQNK